MTLTIPRRECVICSHDALEHLITIPRFPAYMGISTSGSSDMDKFFDQTWGTCVRCRTLQLTELLPLEILYQANHNDSVGPTWKAHHHQFASFIASSSPERNLLEIGGGEGILASLLSAQLPEITYTMVEPNYKGESEGRHVIAGYIEDHLDLVSQADTVVHAHLMEHLYKPVETMRAVSGRMKVGARMNVSFPNLKALLETGGSNALNFEHTFFLSKDGLIDLLDQLGFEIEATRDFGSHSIFVRASKICESKLKIELRGSESAEEHFLDSWRRIAEAAKLFNDAVSSVNGEKGFVFGAHVFSQGLLAMGLREELCAGVLDNSTEKIGRRLYGTSLSVFAPEILRGLENPVVALMASHYQEEVRAQIMGINPKTVIIES